LPWYSLIIFDSSQLSGIRNLELKITDIREQDNFVPFMVYGRGITRVISEVVRGGYDDFEGNSNLYAAKDQRGLQEELGLIFSPPIVLPNLTVVKLGGSSFDYDIDCKNRNIEEVCKILTRMLQEKNRIILTAGAGPYGDISKDFIAQHGQRISLDKHFSQIMVRNLQTNLKLLEKLFDEDYAFLVDLGFFYNITEESTAKRIPLISTAPHYVMAREGIPLQDSDTHTVALAEFYGAERIVLIKRTDGIYDFDPYRGRPFGVDLSQDTPGNQRLLYNWIEAQKDNKRHSKVTARGMLEGNISRIGTNMKGGFDGSTGHLMEDSALRYMMDRCSRVKEIAIVHIAPEEMHYRIGGDQYRHVVTGDTVNIDPMIGWAGVLEQNIRAAFAGKAQSKIVRAE
jgi:uridylate kinase